MGTSFQVTVDCADPDRLARFWATALHYQLAEPPDGHATWTEYWRARGLPEEEIGDGVGYDRIIDGDGPGPRFWFQQVPEPKTIKNRLHLDLDVSGGRPKPFAERRALVEAEAARLTDAGATTSQVQDNPGFDHFAITMQDPEGNEFCVM